MLRALRAYTRGGAFGTREEGRKGTIEPGKLADLIVLSSELLTVPPEQILKTRVDLTVLGGRVECVRVPGPRRTAFINGARRRGCDPPRLARRARAGPGGCSIR